MYKLAMTIIAFRWWLIASLIVATGLSSLSLKSLYFDNSTDSFFLEDDPNLARYDSFLERYGSDEYIVVMLDVGVSWTAENFLKIHTLGEALGKIDDIAKVTSITNVYHIDGAQDDITVNDFIDVDALLEGGVNLEQKKTQAIENAYYNGLFVSSDGRYVSIVLETPTYKGEIDYKLALTAAIRKTMAEPAYEALDPVVAGSPVLDADVRNIVSRESSTYMGFAILLLGIGYWLVFRRVTATILPIFVSLLSTYFAFCFSAAIGAPLGILTSIVPAFLISVGGTASVYLQTELFSSANKASTSVADWIAKAFSRAALPSFLSGLTTAGALLAFSYSNVKPVMDVGLVMGAGLIFAILLTLTILPIAYSFRKTVALKGSQEKRVVRRAQFLSRLADSVYGNRVRSLMIMVSLTIVGVYGVSQLKVDYHYLGTFNNDVPISQSFKKIDAVLGSSTSLEVIVNVDEGSSVRSLAVQEYMDGLSQHIETFENLPLTTYSSVDVIKEIHQAINGGDIAFFSLPDSDEKIENLIFVFELGGGEELKDLIADDHSHTRLSVLMSNEKSSVYESVIAHVNAYIAEHPYHDAGISDIEITGLIPLWTVINQYLMDSQVSSATLAMLIVAVVMCLLFKSIKLGLTMALGNGLAVLWVLGFMGLVGIELDPYTILVGAIAIGILDDDTIHFVKRYQYELGRVPDRASALRETFKHTGQAISSFSIVLVIAFASYMFSDVRSLNNFGLVIAITILLGMVVEFFVNPVLLLFVTEDKRREYEATVASATTP